ncbi:hypothetical protein TSUD_111600 [Trifolium subterraneum]|uniref:LOB domain-containing protein n=1 Tax=Trifolium subterraneum TaxID=3900 RepID=A0A2Z6MFI4_TRISU|nr:hypothetical protein TSUD_111600 [Trifolium subterraneum]
MNNNNNNNSNIVSRNGNGTTQACAACKYQRRKCGPTCILAPYFPHDRQKQFLNAHKLFGVGKITNMIKTVPPQLRDVTMATIMYQSDMRAMDPVGGCYRILQQLQSQYEFFEAELDLTRQHIALCRASSAQSQSQQLAASSNHHPHHHYNDMIMNNNNSNDDASAALNILNQFNQQHFVEEQMNINILPQPQQLQPQYVDDVDLNPNYVPLQHEDLNTWVNSIPLSPLTLQDNKKEVEEEEGENDELVGDNQESDQKPVFDLIKEMNSLDTNGSDNIDPGHQVC